MMRTGFKPIPDEEGTETFAARIDDSGAPRFKPIPDEEGTETAASAYRRSSGCRLQTDPR